MVAVGTLKGYDQLMNLVLDNVEEQLRGIHSREVRLTNRPRGWVFTR
jgi:small nuclear ribonucleoprotein (snRNP)-like protein